MRVWVDRNSKNKGDTLNVGVLCDRMCDGMRESPTFGPGKADLAIPEAVGMTDGL